MAKDRKSKKYAIQTMHIRSPLICVLIYFIYYYNRTHGTRELLKKEIKKSPRLDTLSSPCILAQEKVVTCCVARAGRAARHNKRDMHDTVDTCL